MEPAWLDVRLHAARRVRLRRHLVRGPCCRARMARGGRQLRLGSRHRCIRADGWVDHLRLGRRSNRSQEDHHPGMLVVRRFYAGLGVGAVDTRADGAALPRGRRSLRGGAECHRSGQRIRTKPTACDLGCTDVHRFHHRRRGGGAGGGKSDPVVWVAGDVRGGRHCTVRGVGLPVVRAARSPCGS